MIACAPKNGPLFGFGVNRYPAPGPSVGSKPLVYSFSQWSFFADGFLIIQTLNIENLSEVAEAYVV